MNMINTDENCIALKYSHYSFDLLKLIARNHQELIESNVDSDIYTAFYNLLLKVNNNNEGYVDWEINHYYEQSSLDKSNEMDQLTVLINLLSDSDFDDSRNFLYVLPENHPFRKAVDDDNKLMKMYHDSCVTEEGVLLIVTTDTPGMILESFPRS